MSSSKSSSKTRSASRRELQATLEEELEILRTSMADIEAELESVRARVSSLEAENTLLRGQAMDLTGHRDTLSAENTDLQHRLEAQTEELEATMARLQLTTSEFAECRSHWEVEKSTLETTSELNLYRELNRQRCKWEEREARLVAEVNLLRDQLIEIHQEEVRSTTVVAIKHQFDSKLSEMQSQLTSAQGEIIRLQTQLADPLICT